MLTGLSVVGPTLELAVVVGAARVLALPQVRTRPWPTPSSKHATCSPMATGCARRWTAP